MTPETVSDARRLPGRTDAHGIVSILKDSAANWMKDNAMRLSAALSLYTMLSLAPLLVISIKVVALVAGAKNASVAINHQVSSLMGTQAAEAVKPMIENGGKHGSGVVAAIVSACLLVFSATGVFVELQDSMNTIWGVKPKPNQGIMNFVRTRMLSAGMVFGIGFLLLVSMLMSTILAGLAGLLGGDVKWLAFAADIVISLVVIFALFAGIFKFLPDVKLSWRHVWAGALLTAVLFTIGKYGLGLYFRYGTPTSAFGAAGSLAAVLIWVYYSAFILFFGTEFTKSWARAHDGGVVPDDHAIQVTEEDRARVGIPSQERMKKAEGAQDSALSTSPDSPHIAPGTHTAREPRSIGRGRGPNSRSNAHVAIDDNRTRRRRRRTCAWGDRCKGAQATSFPRWPGHDQSAAWDRRGHCSTCCPCEGNDRNLVTREQVILEGFYCGTAVIRPVMREVDH